MFDNKILSEGITDIVYHFTSLENFLSIVKNNEFVLRASNLTKTSEYNKNGYYYYFSTTRGKNGNEGYGMSLEGTVRITLDGRKLSQRYKGQPFDYWGPSWKKNTQSHEYDEMEDRILSNEPVIKNALDYIIRADVLFGIYNKIENIKSRIENAKQQGKAQIVTAWEHRLDDEKKRCQSERAIIRQIYDCLMNKRKAECLFVYSSEKDFANQSDSISYYGDIIHDNNLSIPISSPENNNKYLFATSYFVALIAMFENTNSDKDIAKIYKMLGYDEYLNGAEIKRVKYNLRQGFTYIVDSISNCESSSDPKFSKITGPFTKYLRTHKFKNLKQFIEFIKYVNTQQYMGVNESLLKEGKEINSLINAFVKKNPNINPKDLEQLFTADPTTVQNSRGVFAGKYCVWIGNQYVNGKLKVGDIPELKKALTTYNINKSQITIPISDIKSLSDLITIISNYTDDFKATRQLSKGEQALEKVYEDADWVVYIPHTYEASRKIGGDTNWCTASSDDRYFNMYTKEGPLYVNIRKSDGAKFQFHFPSRQFMDSKDKGIILENIGLSKRLIEFYNNIDPLFLPYMKYDFVGNLYNGYATVELNNKWNLVDTQGKLFSLNQWFDWIGNFYDGYASVKLNGKWNFIDTQGKLLSPNQWFNVVGNFYNGYVRVKLNNKWNLVDTQGKLFSLNQWFDWIGNFYDGYASVKLNGKWNFIDTQGKLLSPNQWFNVVGNFYNGYVRVKLNNKWNLVDTQGKLFSLNQWFDGVGNFHDGYARVRLNDKWYKIDTKGNIVAVVNEHTVTITKSDLRKIVLECVKKIMNIS